MSARLVDGMPDAVYHSSPALSSSGARKLLPPSCPALFKWERDHGQPHKAVFDFGHAAHAMVLGVGADLAVLEFPGYTTKAAREARDDAYAAGQVPVLVEEFERVKGMAAAIKAHPIASVLLDPDHGKAEQSIFWHDAKHGIDRRVRLDWLPELTDGRLIVADYKTTRSAEPDEFARSAWKYGYHQQEAFYRDGIAEVFPDVPVEFRFIAQEKTAPYLVTVNELDFEARMVGASLNDRAMQTFAECTETGVWPGYSDEVNLLSLPVWATDDFEMEIQS